MSTIEPFPIVVQARTIEQIIEEADELVPNNIGTALKVTWLNEINHDFFEIVKIPQIYTFNAIAGESTHEVPEGYYFALRNIDRFVVGTNIYRSLQLDDVPPGNNGWSYSESSRTFTMIPPPIKTMPAYIRFRMHAHSHYTEGNTNTDTPDAPVAYHHLYTLGLCEKIANAMDDTVKASNYGQHYRSGLAIAQANYYKSG